MKKILLIFHCAVLIFNSAFSQPAIQWQKSLGGTNGDFAECIDQTSDGGFIIAGYTFSNDGDVTGYHGAGDYWVVKLDSSGTIQWQKCFGGTNTDRAYSIQQTMDGGYVVAGYTWSTDGDVTGLHGTYDTWVVKLDPSGNLQWQKCLGGTTNDGANSIQQTADGGYIVAGYTLSNDGDIMGNHGAYDLWTARLDTSGSLQWQKCLGGWGEEYGYSINQTFDGGYIIGGETGSFNGDVAGNNGYYDFWILKLSSIGDTITWQKCLGGTNLDQAWSIQQTVNAGYIVAGTAFSNDGDVTGNHGFYDYWVVNLDSNDNIKWQKCFGGTDSDIAYSIQQTTDGGFIVAGETESNNGDVSGNHGYNDFWVLKLDTGGVVQWKKCLGGSFIDIASSVSQTLDGGYIIAGNTQSTDGDVTGNHGSADFWVVKLSPYVGIEEETGNAFLNISPNPFTTQATITIGKEVHNATFSLYNLLGGKVAEAAGINGESFQFNRGNLRSGVYAFEVREGNKIYRGKAAVY